MLPMLNPTPITLSGSTAAEFEKLARTRTAPARVAALQEAVALSAPGDFLDGFYDDWVLSERYRLKNSVLRCAGRVDGYTGGAGSA